MFLSVEDSESNAHAEHLHFRASQTAKVKPWRLAAEVREREKLIHEGPGASPWGLKPFIQARIDPTGFLNQTVLYTK